MDKEDIQLIHTAKHDPKKFDVLYQKYANQIYNYFWYRTGHDRDVSDDLTQETFVRAFKHLPRFQIRHASYFSYLLTIAHNVLVNYYRTPKPISLDAVGDVPKEIWDDIEKKDAARALWRSIQQLSPTERDILYLRYRRGYKIKEIAHIVRKTENAVKLILSRARKKLAKHPYLTDIALFSDQKHTPRTARYKKR